MVREQLIIIRRRSQGMFYKRENIGIILGRWI